MAEYEQMLQKKHALLNRVEGTTTEVERQQLRRVSSHRHIAATLLPIRSVGVQVFEKSYRKKKKKKIKIVNKVFYFSWILNIFNLFIGRSEKLQLRGRLVVRRDCIRGSGMGRYVVPRETNSARVSQC